MNEKNRVTRRAPLNMMPNKCMSNFHQNIPHGPVVKTKSVIAFLCIFDGFRKPSIRRLIRKPRTLCNKPILTFDPSFYSPSSTKALSDLYKTSIGCPCEIAVDPSVDKVIEMLRKENTKLPMHRVLIHYFGQGCYSPSDSNIFFFSEDLSRYKAMKFTTLLNTCPFPLCIVLDCPQAASLSKIISSKRDSFAFFACGANEKLPLSPSLPLDLFSMCLFQPFTIAMWCQNMNHCNIFDSYKINIDSAINDDESDSDSDSQINLRDIINSRFYSSSSNNNLNSATSLSSSSNNNININNKKANFTVNDSSKKTGHNDATSKINCIQSDMPRSNFGISDPSNRFRTNDGSLNKDRFNSNKSNFGFADSQKTQFNINDTIMSFRSNENFGNGDFDSSEQQSYFKIRNGRFLRKMLNSILEAICFDTQDLSTYDHFRQDPAIFALLKGFALSQRVMLSYNLHPSSYPELKPMMGHVLWNFWDLVLDTCITLPSDTAKKAIFNLFIKTFEMYPQTGSGYFPLFAFFISVPEVHEETALKLFAYLDASPAETAERAARTELPKSIITVENPSAVSLTLLAKLIAASQNSFIEDTSSQINFAFSDSAVIVSGLIFLTVALHINWIPSFKKYINLPIEHLFDAAPFSLLLFGTIMEKSNSDAESPTSKNSDIVDNSFWKKVVSLLEDNRDDIKASALFALGFRKMTESDVEKKKFNDLLLSFLDDKSPVVRIQALFALLQSCIVNDQYESYATAIDKMALDQSNDVKAQFNSIKPFISWLKSNKNIEEENQTLNEDNEKKDFRQSARQRTSSLSALRSQKISAFDFAINGKNRGKSVEKEIAENNPIIPHLIMSLKEPNFEQRFDTNVFNIAFPPISRTHRAFTATATTAYQIPRTTGFLFGKKNNDS